ncbi:MAG: imidazole glycerol phosphate synthase subunit HisH [Bacteroidota bacterium]
MVCIIDYGIGNLRSMEKALEAVGATVVRSDKAEDIMRADRVVLPGVGAFGACADEIRRRNLVPTIHQAVASGKPFLGVCVGMQLLFDVGEEMGEHQGLGIMPGRVVRFKHAYQPAMVAAGDAPVVPEKPLKIPHMGWNVATPRHPSPLLEGLGENAYFYFVHSYHAAVEDPDDILADTMYGINFPAMVQRNNVFGVQFHPEKSHDNGLLVLKNFAHLSI